MQEQLLHEDLTRKIIGCAMKVHTALGAGFYEAIYQRSLEIEMNFQGLGFEREKDMPIFYRDVKVGSRRVDFFVGDLVMVELKAIAQIEDSHINQALNYLEAYNKQIGLLINFGGKSLTFKRLLNKKYKQ
ncbi:GxxExxY protein [Mucilaginibacter lutimaris]|uniref:GxxExxY protein n=1 Tax=Mucilaginibacter lutimaris TaxID=931629 RepID=A0ABW2ZLW6_9SPHI